MLKFIETQFRKIPVKFRWAAFVAFAFISFLSFVHIGSYVADSHHLNWLFWTIGIVFGLLTVSIFKIANDEEKSIEEEEKQK